MLKLLTLLPKIKPFFCHKCCWYLQEYCASSTLSLHTKESSVIQASFCEICRFMDRVPFFLDFTGTAKFSVGWISVEINVAKNEINVEINVAKKKFTNN